jgi:hypothetical protein
MGEQYTLKLDSDLSPPVMKEVKSTVVVYRVPLDAAASMTAA